MPRRRQERQRAKLALWCCLALALVASSCGQQTPPDTRAADESAIRALDAQWEKVAAAKDVDGTVSYYSDDASLLAPNAPIAASKPFVPRGPHFSALTFRCPGRQTKSRSRVPAIWLTSWAFISWR